jgi:carbon-monoxide dehydrogenase medium subunit
MYASAFEYYKATTVQEAVDLLRAHPGAKLLAGGHSLLPQMKLRVAQPPALIDIGRVADLAGICISVSGASIEIGAATTHNAIATSAVIREHCRVLSEAAAQIGDQQVRNRGTIGGSLSHADPAADLPTVVVALGATLTAVGPRGPRSIPAGQFFTDLFTTALAEDEVLTTITVPSLGAGTGAAYHKHEHPASGYAVVGVAALVTLSGGACKSVTIAVGGATANPVRASAAESALTGRKLDPAAKADAIATAAAKVADAITNPLGDHYASAEYRRHLATVLARRAITSAVQRAGG